MAWVVDTCLLIDIAEEDPAFSASSVALLDEKRSQGLVICPVTYIELAPVFEGDAAGTAEFLQKLGIAWPEIWTTHDSQAAFEAWARYVTQKREGKVMKRPIADVLIGAFAIRFNGLLTRNGSDFQQVFPTLTIVGSATTKIG